MLARVIVELLGGAWKIKNRCQYSDGKLIRKIYKGLHAWYQYENASSIAFDSTFLSEPCFPHGMKSIFVSGAAVIGKNCVIFQQVTIGSNTLLDSNGRGAPIIGDNCYIGAGAKIVGKVIIGNNVRIGANTVVHKDVPDNSVVVSGEQKVIIRSKTLDNRFYSRHGHWVFFDDGHWVKESDQNKINQLNS
ncbi:serine acetyltransferase [uncultured Deefgea sp.]|uniref:serine acetyltransferase n=1 Tax=uncultured Deefgea sp. TaxID=1304914 RepID=UPI00262B3168|nr:serine acetyltransferase [uncultured Deefgea sp.]